MGLTQRKHNTLILSLFAAGFVFRLFLAFHAYNTIVFDSKGYSDFAIDFLQGKFPIDCCAKNVGYSLFLSGIYRLFGVENLAAVRLVHVVIDLMTAIVVYRIAQKIFNEKTAIISFIIYLFNPFAAAFTGLALAETLTIFLFTFIIFVLTLPAFEKNSWTWLFTGFLLGILLFVRHSFYYFIFGFLFFWGIRRIKFLIISLIGLLIASSYSLVMYYQTFKKIAIVPPYNMTYEILYTNFSRWHYPEVEFKGIDPLYEEVIQGFWNTPFAEKAAYSQKYKQLFFARLPHERPSYIANLGWNAIWLWDKDHIYTYVDQFYPNDRWPLRILNIALISFGVIGILRFIREKRKKVFREPVTVFTVLLFLYILFLFPLLSNESRHTLASYSLLSLWAGYGVSRLI